MTRGEVLTKEKKKPESIVLFVAVLDANSFSLDKKKVVRYFFIKSWSVAYAFQYWVAMKFGYRRLPSKFHYGKHYTTQYASSLNYVPAGMMYPIAYGGK